jgi:hypothetical protein
MEGAPPQIKEQEEQAESRSHPFYFNLLLHTNMLPSPFSV